MGIAVCAPYWEEKVDWKNAGDITKKGNICARVNGHHYVIGHEKMPLSKKGCGGAKFVFFFTSGPYAGRAFQSTNVWKQGKIDPDYLPMLPDNAIMLSGTP